MHWTLTSVRTISAKDEYPPFASLDRAPVDALQAATKTIHGLRGETDWRRARGQFFVRERGRKRWRGVRVGAGREFFLAELNRDVCLLTKIELVSAHPDRAQMRAGQARTLGLANIAALTEWTYADGRLVVVWREPPRRAQLADARSILKDYGEDAIEFWVQRSRGRHQLYPGVEASPLEDR